MKKGYKLRKDEDPLKPDNYCEVHKVKYFNSGVCHKCDWENIRLDYLINDKYKDPKKSIAKNHKLWLQKVYKSRGEVFQEEKVRANAEGKETSNR